MLLYQAQWTFRNSAAVAGSSQSFPYEAATLPALAREGAFAAGATYSAADVQVLFAHEQCQSPDLFFCNSTNSASSLVLAPMPIRGDCCCQGGWRLWLV